LPVEADPAAMREDAAIGRVDLALLGPAAMAPVRLVMPDTVRKRPAHFADQ